MSRTHNDFGIHPWVLGHEFTDNGEGLVSFIGHRQKDLEIGIFLREGGLEVLVQICVQPFKWSKDRHPGN